jgi:hypothetical protein
MKLWVTVKECRKIKELTEECTAPSIHPDVEPSFDEVKFEQGLKKILPKEAVDRMYLFDKCDIVIAQPDVILTDQNRIEKEEDDREFPTDGLFV